MWRSVCLSKQLQIGLEGLQGQSGTALVREREYLCLLAFHRPLSFLLVAHRLLSVFRESGVTELDFLKVYNQYRETDHFLLCFLGACRESPGRQQSERLVRLVESINVVLAHNKVDTIAADSQFELDIAKRECGELLVNGEFLQWVALLGERENPVVDGTEWGKWACEDMGRFKSAEAHREFFSWLVSRESAEKAIEECRNICWLVEVMGHFFPETIPLTTKFLLARLRSSVGGWSVVPAESLRELRRDVLVAAWMSKPTSNFHPTIEAVHRSALTRLAWAYASMLEALLESFPARDVYAVNTLAVRTLAQIECSQKGMLDGEFELEEPVCGESLCAALVAAMRG